MNSVQWATSAIASNNRSAGTSRTAVATPRRTALPSTASSLRVTAGGAAPLHTVAARSRAPAWIATLRTRWSLGGFVWRLLLLEDRSLDRGTDPQPGDRAIEIVEELQLQVLPHRPDV